MQNKKILAIILLVITLLTLFVPFIALNVGASYDEYGLEMYNNNYNGTVWRLDGNIPEGLGYVDGYFDIRLISNVGGADYSFPTRIYFGYIYNTDTSELVPSSNFLCLTGSYSNASTSYYRNIDLSTMNGYLRIEVLYMSQFSYVIDSFNSIFKTYLKLLFVQNYNNIPIKFIVESDYPSNVDTSNFYLYFEGNYPLNVSGKVLNEDFVDGRTEYVLNTSLCPARYDIQNEYYYYTLRTRYTGYIPYISFYDYEGNFVYRVSLDTSNSPFPITEVYVSPEHYGVITYEYDPFASSTVTSIRLILSNVDYGVILNSYYDDGFDAGFENGEQVGYQNGEQVGYQNGLDDDLGKDVVLGVLTAPHDFLSSFVLFEAGGLSISLWNIFSTVLGVSLFIWFLKMFAGG